MEELAKEVVVAVDNVELRHRLEKLIRLAGCRPNILRSSYQACRKKLTRDDVLVVETNDDVAALTQEVYEVHLASGLENAPAIIGILSTDATRRNIAVCRWIIGGHAALAALLAPDDPDFDMQVITLITRITRR